MGTAGRSILLSRTIVLCVSLAIAAEAMAASDVEPPPALRPGDRVRLETTLEGGRLKGSIESIDGEQVTVVDRKGERSTLPWSSIARLDLQVGTRKAYGKWVLIGGGVGLALGLILPPPKPEFCFGESCDKPIIEKDQQVVLMAGVGILAGLIGTAASKPTDPRWERVQLPYRSPPVTSFGLGGAPGIDSVAFRVDLRF